MTRQSVVPIGKLSVTKVDGIDVHEYSTRYEGTPDGSVGAGQLIVTLECVAHPRFSCCKQLQGGLYLKHSSQEERVEIGLYVAYLVDLTVKSSDKPNARNLFISQLLEHTADGGCPEIQQVFREIFHSKSGLVREEFNTRITGLQPIIHLDTYMLHEKYRAGKSLGALCLQAIHLLFARLCKTHGTVAVVLTPGLLNSIAHEYPNTSNITVQTNLKAFYSRQGYTVWRPHGDDSKAVMGSTIRTLIDSVAAKRTAVAAANRSSKAEKSMMARALAQLASSASQLPNEWKTADSNSDRMDTS